ncbi:TetR family transcriptional regulator [Petrocella sp. FN5]|uniref:TetR family transcriptional regulator n=1 Tax=Petrocella sp. FN5 TaxID=3032002 RepID=UPI0023DB0828|nr:TetR family transcriptional regulator [Petrocella sp. FN5]MDF1618048.1 TetR family transcriptional regulator [Petrocella sp. FN5]
MPPKVKFDKEAIIDAAFDVAKKEGLTGITARSVAARLGASVAPIYVNFATIDDLVIAVVERIFSISEALLAKQKGKSIFENIGKASLEFAREYPVLYQELSIQPNPYMASYEKIENNMIEAMAEDEMMRDWTLEERRQVFLKMRVFQMGLSAMVANGHVPSWMDNQGFDQLLMEVGDDILRAQLLKREEKL